MNNKHQELVLENFQVEELEKRYEMGWIEGGSATITIGSDGTVTGSGTVTF